MTRPDSGAEVQWWQLLVSAGGMTPTRIEFDVLEWAAHNEKYGWFASSNRTHRKRDFLRCVALGWLRELEHLCEKVDGDGFHLEPTRYAVGYELTEAGKAALVLASREARSWVSTVVQP